MCAPLAYLVLQSRHSATLVPEPGLSVCNALLFPAGTSQEKVLVSLTNAMHADGAVHMERLLLGLQCAAC